jgi:radical SAM-linked protein
VQEPTDPPIEPVDSAPAVLCEPVQRWRLVVARGAVAGEGQRELLNAWEAALLASGLPVAGLDAPRPKPRFAPAAPLAGGIPGEAELVDVWLVERLPLWHVREALMAVMPAGHRLVDAYDVWLGEAALPGRVVASVYRVDVDVAPSELQAACGALLASPELRRDRRKGETVIAYDLRPFLDGLDVREVAGTGGAVLRMTLRHDPEKGIGRPEEALAAIAGVLGREPATSGLVRESLVLGEPPAHAPPSPRRGPRPPGPRPPGSRPPRR